MAFNQGPLDNVVSYYRAIRRRTGKAGRDFFSIFQQIIPVLVLGRDFSDTNRALQCAHGQIANLDGPAAAGPTEFGSLVMLNDARDCEVQAVTMWSRNIIAPGLPGQIFPLPKIALANLTNLWNPFEASAGSLFFPQIRNRLTDNDQTFIPGSTRFQLGISNTQPPTTAIGMQLTGHRNGQIIAGLSEYYWMATPTIRVEFNPPMVVPRFAGLVVTVSEFPVSITGFQTEAYDCEFAVEFRELGP